MILVRGDSRVIPEPTVWIPRLTALGKCHINIVGEGTSGHEIKKAKGGGEKLNASARRIRKALHCSIERTIEADVLRYVW